MKNNKKQGYIIIILFLICSFPLRVLAAPPQKEICPAPESHEDRDAAVRAACKYFNMIPSSWGLHSAFGSKGEVITCLHFGCRESMLPAPVQISPANRANFDHFPRTTTLKWRAVHNASSYTVEIDCYHCCLANKWCADVGKVWKVVKDLTTTSYTFDFVGKQSGRWRVWAVGADGTQGSKSDWWEFVYTK